MITHVYVCGPMRVLVIHNRPVLRDGVKYQQLASCRTAYGRYARLYIASAAAASAVTTDALLPVAEWRR